MKPRSVRSGFFTQDSDIRKYLTMMAADIENIKAQLFAAKILDSAAPRVTHLGGGVSSDIYLLESGGRKVVLKQALEKLRVRDEWRVDVSRNLAEQHYIEQVSTFLPQSMPRVLHRDERQNYFVMEYLAGYRDWKSTLMAGEADAASAQRAGSILGTIHARTRGDAALLKRFNTMDNFHALRTDPYLLTTAARHPILRAQICEEAIRLEQTRLCLVHGDYSPKNIMLRGHHMIVIDCEVAWYGEPAFDTAFLCNHFLLKALYHHDRAASFIELVAAAWKGYVSCLHEPDPDLEQRTGRLLLMLMLARIDGKSPVEYITDEENRQRVRDFVYRTLPEEVFLLDEICDRWRRHLNIRPDPNRP